MSLQSYYKTVALLCILAFAVWTNVAYASTNVYSSVDVSASSGGNRGKTVREGESVNTVRVETVVNGEIVRSYSETSSDPIHYQDSYSVGVERTPENDVAASSGASVGAKAYAGGATGTVGGVGEAEPTAGADASVKTETAVSETAAAHSDGKQAGSLVAQVWYVLQATVTKIFEYVFEWIA
jgi:hypothetical protein